MKVCLLILIFLDWQALVPMNQVCRFEVSKVGAHAKVSERRCL